ncbi:MAG: tetratricopeptide repeat protein [Cytophagales bacterium]|nr:tetratricopeptide repeat protein [Cytophagales bacterium]
MSRNKVKLWGIGLAMVLVISLLPKYVVQNDPQPLEEKTASEKVSDRETTPSAPGHHSLIPEQELAVIENLKKQYENSQNPNEKLKFADSLFNLYRKHSEFHQAARFAELRMPTPAELEDLLAAGNAYYQAFSTAFSAQQAHEAGAKARQYFEKALEQAPDSLGAKARLAMTYTVSDQPMQAALKLREVLQADSEHPEALYNMGMLSVQSGKYNNGIERFSKLVSLQPAHLQARYFLGVCYFESGKKQLAKKQFELVKNMSADPVVQKEADKYLRKI